MILHKHYREDARLRASFNALAEQTFGLNFENWYQMGYWTDCYDPYSLEVDGKIVANVSVNRTDMLIRGQRKRLYQLGTVMTAPEYRNRGYIRRIMEEIQRDLQDADGVYLFAGDDVVDFYPKFGFVPGEEYLWEKDISQNTPRIAMPVTMKEPGHRAALALAMENSVFQTACTMVDNPGLIFFYAAQFLSECVYHFLTPECWVIAEEEGENLMIHNVFAPKEVTLEQVISCFGSGVRHVTLGFAPAREEGWTKRPMHQEDCHFFVRGDVFGGEQLRIPSLSHA